MPSSSLSMAEVFFKTEYSPLESFAPLQEKQAVDLSLPPTPMYY